MATNKLSLVTSGNSTVATTNANPQVELEVEKGKGQKEKSTIELSEIVDVKGWKALGNRLSLQRIFSVNLLETPEEEVVPTENENTNDVEIGDTIELEIKKENKDQLGLF